MFSLSYVPCFHMVSWSRGLLLLRQQSRQEPLFRYRISSTHLPALDRPSAVDDRLQCRFLSSARIGSGRSCREKDRKSSRNGQVLEGSKTSYWGLRSMDFQTKYVSLEDCTVKTSAHHSSLATLGKRQHAALRTLRCHQEFGASLAIISASTITLSALP